MARVVAATPSAPESPAAEVAPSAAEESEEPRELVTAQAAPDGPLPIFRWFDDLDAS
jgi:hypothetical protein